MKPFKEELKLRAAGQYLDLGASLYGPTRVVSFDLFRKQTTLGDVSIDQFWMSVESVYGRPKQSTHNQTAIVDAYWTLCELNRTARQSDVQQSYLLAKLFPFTRQKGSRRIVRDAVLGPGGRRKKTESIVQELEAMLAQSEGHELTMIQFRDKTADLIGPCEYSEQDRSHYYEFEEQLLGPGQIALGHSTAEACAKARCQWAVWTRKFGRRAHKGKEKHLLDIFSYECRAALHRCYSAVWGELLPHLTRKYGLSHESEVFHSLWHFEQSMSSNHPDQRFHLFHGHVFALHPAMGTFIQTKTGSELLGQIVKHPKDHGAFHRLLGGLFIAIADYERRCEADGQERRWAGQIVTSGDIAAVDARERDRKRGQRRLKKFRDE